MSIELGRRLRKARLAKGLKQSEIAAKCGIARGRISAYETGRAEPFSDTLLNLAQVLDVDLFYLFATYKGGDGNEH